MRRALGEQGIPPREETIQVPASIAGTLVDRAGKRMLDDVCGGLLASEIVVQSHPKEGR